MKIQLRKKLLQIDRLTIKLKNQNQELVWDICFSLEQAGTITLSGQSGSKKIMTSTGRF